ncbi:MAG: DUF4304 domain-containing protein, partial [Bacteroidota bacterium]
MVWDQARRTAVKVFSSAFKTLGYKNSGRTMWRYRKEFVDVVQIYVSKYGNSFCIELGCHPRKDDNLKNFPKPWHTMFRGRMEKWYDFFELSEEELSTILPNDLDNILRQERDFFSNFTSLEDCMNVLNGKAVKPET